MKKKIISLLLALVMLVSMLPMSAITALAAGEPTVISNVGIAGAPVPIAGQNAKDYIDAESVFPYAPGEADAIETEIDSWYQGEISDFNIDPPTPFTGDFVAGEKYFLVMWISAKDGYIYDDELDIFAFGSDSVIYKIFDETYAIVAINYTAALAKSDEAVTAVDVEIPPFSKGDVVSSAYYPLETDNENVLATVFFGQGSEGNPVDPSAPYFLGILLDAKDGYVFDEPTVTINGKEYAVEGSYSDQAVPNVYSVAFEITDLLTPITITGLPAPVVGQTVEQWWNSITDEPSMSGPVAWAGEPMWLEGEFDNYYDAIGAFEVNGPFTGTFQDNQHYTLLNPVGSKEEGKVPASATVVAAGTSKTAYESLEESDGSVAIIYLTYTFGTPAEKEVISSVNLTMPEVVAGTAPTAADVTIDGATCTVKEMEWISPVTHEDAYTTLEDGKVYQLILELTPADGYKFSGKNPPAFTINGKKVEIDYEFTGQSAYYAEILFRLGTPTPYCIDFRENGGSGEYFWEFGSVDYVLPECPYTHSTKVFGGWKIDDVVYQPGDIIQLTKDVSAYPVWEENIWTLTFTDGTNTNSYTVTRGNDYTLQGYEWTLPDNKAFKCWNVGGVEKNPGDKISVTSNMTITAVLLDIVKHTVSFDKNGGSGSMADVSVIEGQSYTLPSCTFSAPSYKQFRCWSVDGVEKQVGDKITVNKDTTVKAMWVYTTPATAVTLTDNLGAQTVLTEDATGTGYTYDAETATLTLNNWSGQKIQANGNFDLHLKGTNTITMVDGEGDNTYGIYTNYKNVSITADEGGTLNINGRDLTKYAYGMYGNYYFYNGTVNIDIKAPANCIRGIMGSMYINDSNKAANLNIRVENTKEGYNVYALQNGNFTIKDCTNDINVNVEAYATKTGVANACISSLTIQNSAPKVNFKADNDGGDIDDRAAFDANLGAIRLNAGGKVTFDGPVRNSGYDLSYGINRNTVTTTPANNEFMWHKVNSYWTITDLSGNTLEKVVFEHSATPTTLVYRGDGFVSIPSMKVGDGTLNTSKDFIYIDAYLIGSSGLGNLSYKLASGSSLPAGLTIASGGYICGVPTTPCAAGTAEIIVTDDNGTRNNTSDDQTVTVALPYGEITEGDSFITVDGTSVEMKADGSGTGWSYDGTTKTLTLNGYNGGMISSEKDFNLHLKGTNTITMADGAGDNTYGIYTNYKNVSITADVGGTLNINGRDLTKYAYGMYGNYYFYNGTVNIDIKAPANCIRGIMGSMYINDSNKAANLNIRVENTKEGYNVYALQNGNFTIKDCTNDINVNVEAYATKTGVANACISSLTIQNSAPKVSFKADNDGGAIEDRAAFESNLSAIRLNAGGKVTFDGPVINSGYDLSYGINRNTVTTTPANNEFMWHKVNSYWTITDLLGNTLEKVVFEHSATPTTLVYRGDGFVSIPSMKVGDGTLNSNGKNFIYIDAYLIGSSGLGNLSYKLASGSSLPAGLTIASGGYICGVPTTPCAAGTAEIIVTDDNGTRNNTSDDQTVTVSLPYGRITSAKPVTAITLNKDTIILDKSGTDTLTATLTPLDVTYPDVRLDYNSGITVTASEAVNGVITLNVKAGDKAGKYTVSVVSLDTGVHKEFTVYVKETTPNITLDADDNLLRGFSGGYNYKITAEGCEDYTFTATGSTLELKPEWIGKTLNIIRVNAEESCNSDPKTLSLTTKTVTVTKGTGSGDYIVGDIVTVTADEAPVGYRFAGWSGAEGLTFKNSTDANDKTIKFEMPNEDVNLTAIYEIKKFTVAFNNSGYGTGTMASQTVEYGDYVLPNCTFTPNKGYKFQHWRIGYGATANPGDTIQITSDVTIYAIFEYDRDTEFNITVNNGTAKIASTPVTKAAQFNRITITASGVDGKVFSHWETTSEGVTFGNANSESTYFDMPYNDVVVTAVYVDPHTHVGVKQDGKDATCTTDGWKDYYKCSCDALYADEACTIEITDLEAWKIGEGKIAAGHIYGDLKPAQEAIHTATVLKGAVDAHYFCDECDTYFDSNKNATTLDALTGDAPSHSGGTATCNAKAKCSTCGASYGEVNKNNHSALTTLKAVSATCSKTGLTEGKKCTACGVVTVAQKTVAKKAHTYKSVTTKATTSKNGSVVKKCSVCGSQASKTTIYYAKKIKLSTTTYTYNGKEKKPTVTVYDSKGKKISSSNYEVTYKDNKKVGKATVTVKFKGSKYSGSLKTTFTINPKKTTVSKLTAAKKSLKVKITKQSSQVTGYEIQYSTSKKFTKSTTKTKKVTSYKTTAVTLKSLKAKKTYYVRVRTYKTVNGKKYYSDWSSYKSKKTK